MLTVVLSYIAGSRLVRIGLPAIAVILACSIGCGKRPEPLPTTHPVHGVVKLKNGSLATGGIVQFCPDSDVTVLSSGTIGADGSFSITTSRPGVRGTGAVAGPNRVSVLVSSVKGPAGQELPISFAFSQPFVVKPGDNSFTLVVEVPN
jgi:hypothetical protein